MWSRPEPAVIHWVSLSLMTPPPPWLSWCTKVPSGCWGDRLEATVRVPQGLWAHRCVLDLAHLVQGMKGSRSARSTPAKASHGKPSPSKPLGAVVTERTGRGNGSRAGLWTRGRSRGRCRR